MTSESQAPGVRVVAAVIEREGKILICQRKPGGRHALKWEFPGGKVEPGEEDRTALARELREELGIEAVVGEALAAYDFRYGEAAVTHLHFFRVREFAGEIRNLDFARVVWEQAGRLAEYDFLEGDVEFIQRLAAAGCGPGGAPG